MLLVVQGLQPAVVMVTNLIVVVIKVNTCLTAIQVDEAAYCCKAVPEAKNPAPCELSNLLSVGASNQGTNGKARKYVAAGHLGSTGDINTTQWRGCQRARHDLYTTVVNTRCQLPSHNGHKASKFKSFN